MTLSVIASVSEQFSYDTTTGAGSIGWRAPNPPKEALLADLDDHYLGARVLLPLKKPWLDIYDNVQQHASPGSVHAIVVETLRPWSEVTNSQTANSSKSIERPINFMDKQVCFVGGAALPCPKAIPVYQWEPQHEFRGLRHLMAYRRWGWESDKFLADCAVSRVCHEPSLYNPPKNQREMGWPLLLLAEAYQHLEAVSADAVAAITKMIDLIWATHGDNYLTLNTDAKADHGYLPVCSWQHAILVKAMGRLVRRGWPDPRATVLYKCGVKGLDAMRQPGTFSWVKDWDPATGKVMEAETLYGGTSLWTACAYAESLSVLPTMAPDRTVYLKGFMAKSNALIQTDKNFDAAASALLNALVK